jgi:hypothetical protein
MPLRPPIDIAGLLSHAEFGNDILHQTPLGERRLEEIQADKGREQQPVPTVKPSQRHGKKYEGSRYGADVLFHFHFVSS